MTTSVQSPQGFHLLSKPSGSTCNIDCTYCFFLSKQALYPNDASRMSQATLEAYLRQQLEAQPDEAVIAWQGGEPTLMKLEFFRHAVELVERFRRPVQQVLHTFQTNGLLLDDDWCAFFREHGFLVGLSVDGPRELHNAYRLDRRGKGTFELVVRGWQYLARHGVDTNILCTVNAANQAHGREVYRFFRDELHASWIQFIPIVERASADTLEGANRGWSEKPGKVRPLYLQQGGLVTERSVGGSQYGQFLVDVFEEWVRHDVGKVYVQLFDVTLEAVFDRHLLCVHAPTCGRAPVLEHNGDLYSCDHYVEPDYLLGNIHQTPLQEMVDSPRQREFGQQKLDSLTAQCRDCRVRAWCHGGCPKDRFVSSRDGEPGQNYLCPGLELFFSHAAPAFLAMAQLIRRGRYPAELMTTLAIADAGRGPDAPCTCGGGQPFSRCHGDGASLAPSQTARQSPILNHVLLP